MHTRLLPTAAQRRGCPGLAAIAIALSLLPTIHAQADASGAGVPLVAGGQPQAVIIHSADPLTLQTIARFRAYLREHAGADLPAVPAPDAVRRHERTFVVLDDSAGHRLLQEFDVAPRLPDERPDAFHVQVARRNGRTIVAIAGGGPTGAKFGAYRLMEELQISPGAAVVPPLDLSESPFFKTRSVSLFNVWRVPVEVIRQCNLEGWPVGKIALNVDMYDRFGFNALETHDRFHEDFLQAVYGISRAEWRTKVHAMAARAHANGMAVFLRQWGNSVALPVKKIEGGFTPFGYVNLAPDIPEERRRWEVEIRDYVARHYAAHVDHVIGHWADAGGIHAGSKATITDAMQLHNELQAAFRAINPRVQTSFNLWGMQNPHGHRGWPGYVDHRTLTRSGVLAMDVLIAQTTRAAGRRYSEQVTGEIREDGYRAAVWTWRRGDTEVRLGDPGLRIRIHGVMADYFHAMPGSARELEWHNIERNQHGIATDVNFYVASRLMWNPQADVDAALNKYCALVFGEAHAAAAAEAFLTIEACRDVERQVHPAVVKDPEAAAARARHAIAGLARVVLPASHRSRLPSVLAPDEMLTQMREALTSIADNADVIAGPLRRLEALIAQGRNDEARAVRAELERRAQSLFGSIAGGMEGLWLRERLQAKFPPSDVAPTPAAAGFRTASGVTLEAKGAAFVLKGRSGGLGTAIRELERPIIRKAEIQFTFSVLSGGASRNGGIAVGPTADHLIHCMVYVGGKRMTIEGSGLVEPVRANVEGLDPAKPIRGKVTVDLEHRRITFEVGGQTLSAPLRRAVSEIGWHGFAVDRATSARFDALVVNHAE